MSDFDKLINASDLIEWIMETYPDWCIGDVRGIVNHVNNMPTKSNTLNALGNNECVSRQAAIEHIEAEHQAWGDEYDVRQILGDLEDLPSAQPERKRGFWYALEKGNKGYSAGDFKCSVCGEPNRCYSPKPYFCPNCGADMRGEE